MRRLIQILLSFLAFLGLSTSLFSFPADTTDYNFQWRATNLHAPQMEPVEHIMANDSAVYVFFKDWHGNRELHRYKDGKFKKMKLDSAMSHRRTFMAYYHISNKYLYNTANNDVFRITEDGFEKYTNYKIVNVMGPYVLRGYYNSQYISSDGGDTFEKLPDSNYYWAVNYNRLYYSRNGSLYSSLHDGRDEVKYLNGPHLSLELAIKNIDATFNEVIVRGNKNDYYIFTNRGIDTIYDNYSHIIINYFNGYHLRTRDNSIMHGDKIIHKIRLSGTEFERYWSNDAIVFHNGEYCYYESGKGLVSTVDFNSFKYHGFANIGNSLNNITVTGNKLYLNDEWERTSSGVLGYNTGFDGVDFDLVDIRYEENGQVKWIFDAYFKVLAEDDKYLTIMYNTPQLVVDRYIAKISKDNNNFDYYIYTRDDYSLGHRVPPILNDSIIISHHQVADRNRMKTKYDYRSFNTITLIDIAHDSLKSYIMSKDTSVKSNIIPITSSGILSHLPHRFDGLVYYNSNNFVVLDSTFESLGYVRTLDTLGNLIPEPFFSDMNESGDTLTAQDTLGNVFYMLAGTDTTFRQVAHSERRRYWSGDRLQYQDNMLSFDYGDNFYQISNGLNIRDAEYFKGELYAILEDGAFYRLEKESIGSSKREEISSLVFPNPSTGIFNFKKAVSGKLLSSDGSQIMAINNENTIDLSDSPNGVYFLHTSDGDVIKLVKGE
ncbi:MAG: hypothetical protein Kapaf2KO_06580 [Candidatus Kapaibacteriales bacterium]